MQKKLSISGKLIYSDKETEEQKEVRLKKVSSTISELFETEEAYIKDLEVMVEVCAES